MDPDTEQAERTLAELDRLRRRSQRRAHGGAWLPALGVAVLLLASTALYRHPFGQTSTISADYPYWAGLPDEQRDPVLSYAFWFLGIPLLFAVTGGWYRWRARRYGVRVAWPLFVGAGLGVLVLLAVLAAVPSGPQPDGLTAADGSYWSRLLTPLLPVAATLVALGWAERSRGLVLSGAWIALLALWLCGSYPLGSLPGWVTTVLGGGEPSLGGQLAWRPGHYLVLMALPLLVIAAVRLRRARQVADD